MDKINKLKEKKKQEGGTTSTGLDLLIMTKLGLHPSDVLALARHAPTIKAKYVVLHGYCALFYHILDGFMICAYINK